MTPPSEITILPPVPSTKEVFITDLEVGDFFEYGSTVCQLWQVNDSEGESLILRHHSEGKDVASLPNHAIVRPLDVEIIPRFQHG